MAGQSQQSPVQEQPASGTIMMQVKVISPSDEREKKPTLTPQILSRTDMGQQQRFDTLDQIAIGLIKADSSARWEAKIHPPQPRK